MLKYNFKQRKVSTEARVPDRAGYVMLMSPKKGETAVHGCHCPGDMVVRIRTVLAIPRSWYVCFSAYFAQMLVFTVPKWLDNSKEASLNEFEERQPQNIFFFHSERSDVSRFIKKILSMFSKYPSADDSSV